MSCDTVNQGLEERRKTAENMVFCGYDAGPRGYQPVKSTNTEADPIKGILRGMVASVNSLIFF